MTRQELENKTVKELIDICKKNKLTYYKGKKRLTKLEMIEKIENNDCEESNRDNVGKLHYIETIQIGTLVAFREPKTNKLNTAMVVSVKKETRTLLLQTSYNDFFKVPYDSIMWVKTGTRWPKGIYNELKGIKENE